MSGTSASWTPERRLAHAKRLRTKWRDPNYRARQSKSRAKAMECPLRRAASSTRMKILNQRIRNDDALRNKVIRGQKRVRRSPEYRAMQSLVMKEIMSRPEQRRRARFHCIKINKNKNTRRRQWATRRKKAAQAIRATGERA